MTANAEELARERERVYIARQPIFNAEGTVCAYELLYRERGENAFRVGIDGNEATGTVLSEALLNFGLEELTQGKPAFVNFTGRLLEERVPLLLNPAEFVVEILETVSFTPLILDRLRELKEAGYRLALDDYTGDLLPDGLLPFLDIIKVDFRMTTRESRERIIHAAWRKGKRVLAEKLETEEDYEQARKMGVDLFQGYYFARPAIMQKQNHDIATVTYLRLIRVLSEEELHIDRLAQIVGSDVHLTYRLLKKIRSCQYYRGHVVTSVRQSLTLLGAEEARRWIMLVLLRGMLNTGADELVRIALVRAYFCEAVAACIGHRELSFEAFQAGLLSVIEYGDGESLRELPLASWIKEALGGGQNPLRSFLDLALFYESGEWEQTGQLAESIHLGTAKMPPLYRRALADADKTLKDD